MTKLDISCCLCLENASVEVQLPDGWMLHYKDVNTDNAFCPKHSVVREWADGNCSGCVGGWTDCTLFKDFAYRKRGLTEADFAVIKTGRCPRRTNGTVMLNIRTGTMEDIDLTSPVPEGPGAALVQAIREYWVRWPL